MLSRSEDKGKSQESKVYKIKIKGQLDKKWTDWFDGMEIKLDNNGNTLLIGSVDDQAALYGLINKIRDLGIILISLIEIESK